MSTVAETAVVTVTVSEVSRFEMLLPASANLTELTATVQSSVCSASTSGTCSVALGSETSTRSFSHGFRTAASVLASPLSNGRRLGEHRRLKDDQSASFSLAREYEHGTDVPTTDSLGALVLSGVNSTIGGVLTAGSLVSVATTSVDITVVITQEGDISAATSVLGEVTSIGTALPATLQTELNLPASTAAALAVGGQTLVPPAPPPTAPPRTAPARTAPLPTAPRRPPTRTAPRARRAPST